MPDAGHPTEMMMDEIPDTQNAPAEHPVDPVDRVLERARGRSDVWVFGSAQALQDVVNSNRCKSV